MSIVRELRAKFSADAKQLQKAFQDIKKSAQGLVKSGDGANKSIQGMNKSSAMATKSFKDAQGRMMVLNKSADSTAKTFKTTGTNIATMGKQTVVVSKGVQTTSGRLMALNKSADLSARSFKTAGGSVTTLGKHFSATEVKAMGVSKQITQTSGGLMALNRNTTMAAKSFKTSGRSITDMGRNYTLAKGSVSGFKDTVQKVPDVVNDSGRKVEKGVRSQISKPFTTAVGSVRDFTKTVAGIGASLGVFSLVSSGINTIKSSLGGAIARYDTLNNFPRVLELMGFDAESSSKAIARLSEGIDGLPTTMDSVVSTAQRIAIMTNDIDSATETTLALNNAFLASGSSSADAQRGLEQYVQMLSIGKVDLEAWRTIQETMPLALNKTAEAFGYTGASAQNDLYAALKDGEITFDQLNKKLIELSEGTGGFAEMAKTSGGGIATSWSNMGTAIVRGTANILGAVDEALGGTGTIASYIEKFKDKINLAFKGIVEVIPVVIGAFRNLFKFFNGDTDMARNILERLGLSSDVIDSVLQRGKTMQEALSKIRNYIDAFIAFMSGNDGKAISILSMMGLNKDQIFSALNAFKLIKNGLGKLKDFAVGYIKYMITYYDKIVTGLTEAFNQLYPKIKPLLEDFLAFIQSSIKKLVEFWNSDGKQFVEAIQNAFGIILSVVKFIMPLVLGIIKSVWGNIKGVITGALDIIMGVVKIFSGLFTGDFKKMWEGVKQLFFGAVQFIWNLIQLMFYGKILKGATTFIRHFSGGLSKMWQGVKALFTGSVSAAWQTIKNGWARILASTKSVFTSMWNFIKNTWNTIKSITSGSISLVRSVITGGWNFIKNLTKATFSNIWNTVKSIFTNVKNFISSSVGNIKSRISNTWNGIKKATTDTFRGIYNTIRDRFTDIVNAAKNLPKRIGDGIGKMASKVTGGVTKVINSLASTLGKGVNGVIGGVNWVLGKIGVSDKNRVPTWPVPKYARGTDGHPGGLAVVGDGRGTYRGQELIQHPDGTTYLSPDTDTIMDLPAGSQVLNARDTKKALIPQYAKGIGSTFKKTAKKTATHLWGETKKVGSKAKDVALDVFDYVKNPGKLLDLALNTLGINKPEGGSFVGNMARGGFNKVKDSAIGYVKKKLGEFGGGKALGFGSPFGWSSSYGWRIHPITGKRTHHNGADMPAPQGTPIPAQAGGTVSLAGYHPIRGNYVRVKSGEYERIYQHNVRNAVKTGQTVKKGQTVGYVGSTGSSTGPHLHYEVLKNGKNINPKGYADGGIVDKAQLAWIAEGGWAESIISHDPAKRVSQQAIWEQTGRELGFMPGNNKEVISLLIRIARAVEAGQDLSVIMEERVVAKILAPYISDWLDQRKDIKGIFSG